MDVRDLPPITDECDGLLDVSELRRLAPTVNNHAALGRMFGISKQHARAICLGRKRAL